MIAKIMVVMIIKTIKKSMVLAIKTMMMKKKTLNIFPFPNDFFRFKQRLRHQMAARWWGCRRLS